MSLFNFPLCAVNEVQQSAWDLKQGMQEKFFENLVKPVELEPEPELQNDWRKATLADKVAGGLLRPLTATEIMEMNAELK